jgi:alpha-L-rhamnosidase
MPAFYTNFLRDIRDIQGSDGTVTDTVPHRYGRRPADPAWGSAYPLILWYMYEYYGDQRLLEEHYEGIKAWTDYLSTRAENGIVNYYYYGDWVPIEKTPGNVVSTFYYYWSADIVSRVAAILGKTGESKQYRKLADSIRDAFNRKFLDRDSNSYANGSQTANLLPLYLDLAPKDVRGSVLSDLINDIVYAHNTHLTTGIIGTKYLLPLLTRVNRSDLAYELATQTTYPSWGYMVESGATTLWELWQDKTGPSMNSHNHPMLGSIGGWFFNALAGINLDPRAPGFRRIRIDPQVVRDLRWASGTVGTLRGPVSSSWSRTEDSIRLEVTIPVGSEAEIHMPALGLSDVTVRESDKVVWSQGRFQPGVLGLTGAHQKGSAIVFAAGSGTYTFLLTGTR